MVQLIQKNKIFIFIIFLFLINNAYSQSNVDKDIPYFGFGTHINVHINLGISYIVNLSTDMDNKSEHFNLDVPFGIAIDTRFIEWFSLYGGIEVLYCVNSFSTGYFGSINYYYIHNLLVRLPYIVRFYPFVYKSEQYENIFLSAGVVINFSPLSYYYIKNDDKTYYGNIYNSKRSFVLPSDMYSPANIGLRLSMGNNFSISNKNYFGLELYLLYLFIPTINGYVNGLNYNLGGDTLLNFSLSVGIVLSIGIKAYTSIK